MLSKLLAAALLALVQVGCLADSPPAELSFTVAPTAAGAEVEMEVSGGPGPTAWIGFGVGPGVDRGFIERVSDVRAIGDDDLPLPLEPHGYAGWRLEVPRNRSWKLIYSLDLEPRAGDGTFYRSSVRSEDYLVLVGSDAWPRLYGDPRPLAFEPGNRPPGIADSARIAVSLPENEDWTLAGAGDRPGDRVHPLAEHPASSVTIAGRLGEDPGSVPGIELRRHAGWRVLRSRVEQMTADLATTFHERLGPPGDRRALAVLLPLPPQLRPSRGLRTAGMVRSGTVLLYGGSAGPEEATGIQEPLAVFLAHELFHLYVPSAIPVTRDLSWLSEGWAMRMGRLAAVEAGLVSPARARRQLDDTYRRYLAMGGYRAGSLPEASLGPESERDLLYLRGELVFRLLDREWSAGGQRAADFGADLWSRLLARYDGRPLDAAEVHDVLAEMVGPDVVRRYVVGTAPLTHGALGLGR